jgi:pyruvate formate-lyase activating enzyme-like uncharacterized protein
MAKKFEVNLTPQNEEWIKLIPNAVQNNDIIFNKLVEMAINEGLLLEVISQSLTVGDLSKFKTAYSKMQAKRAEHMAELDVQPMHVERKRVVQTQTVEVESEVVDAEDFEEVVEAPKPAKKEKKMSHGFGNGFDESTF